ncbi:MAG: efflux RND transporter permease subunit [Planctomycetes bacterium]|nr:efflux RND transporter permease subunit [Planctomycetota bacterium]
MLNRLITACLNNRLLVIVLTLVVIGAGIQAMLVLPLDAFPDTTPVQVQINTVAPSLSPLEIERQLVLSQSLDLSARLRKFQVIFGRHLARPEGRRWKLSGCLWSFGLRASREPQSGERSERETFLRQWI